MSYTSGLGQAHRVARRPSYRVANKLKAPLIAGTKPVYLGGLGALGTAMGPDSHATQHGDMVSVSASWAQRAVNAFNAHNGSVTRIHVGGGVGPATIAGLHAASHILPPTAAADDLRVTHDPSTSHSRVTSHALISRALYTALGALQRVADPPRPASSTHHTTSTALITAASASPSSTPTPSTGKTPGAPDAPPTDTSATVGSGPGGEAVVVDEGDNPWLIPAIIAGSVVVVGSIGYVVWKRRKPATPNRRRKNKRRRR